VPAHAQELLLEFREANGLPLDALEDALGQDDPVALHFREPVEFDVDAAVARVLERDDAPAIDGPRAHRAAQLGEHGLRLGAVRGHDLCRKAGTEGSLARRRRYQKGEAPVALAHEKEATAHTGEHVPVVEAHVVVLDGADARGRAHHPAAPGTEKLRELDAKHLMHDCHAEQLSASPTHGQVGLDREVEVRVLVASKLFGDDGKCRRIRTEVLAGTLEQLGLLGRSLLRHLLHEALE
jgi:hypothetical protein